MRSTTQFVCQQCGAGFPKWLGQCPSCGTWNSLAETIVSAPNQKSIRRLADKNQKAPEPIKLSSVKSTEYNRRLSTKIAELDRVLGGGILPGMVTLVAGEPGIGKSTLLLQIAGSTGGKVFYIAGEESAAQIANRAKRLGIKGDNITVLEETDVDAVLGQVEKWEVGSGRLDPPAGGEARGGKSNSLIIVDSIQTMTTGDLTGTAGSIGQVKECANRLAFYSKRTGVPLFLAGHVTKEGAIAGPRVLEHLVDTVLWFEGSRSEVLRVLRAVKNRFGATDEVGIFSMEERGLVEVANPSKLFLGEAGLPAGKAGLVSGSVATPIIEGTRPLLVEIQALVSPTKLAFPKRSASGVDGRRLEIIIAVLARRVGLPLWEYDVFVNVAGGIKIAEPAADLAIALAIASAFYGKPVASGTFAVGEVGLLGEIREVVYLERRVKEARRIGFKTPVTKREARTVGEAIRKYISK